MAFNPDEFLKSYGKTPKQTAKPGKFDPDEFLANYKLPEEEPAPQPAAPTVDYAAKNQEAVKAKLAQIQSEIASGKRADFRSPEPGTADFLKAALDPREMAEDAGAGVYRGYKSATLGLGPLLTEKIGGPTRAQMDSALANRPGTEFGGELVSNAAVTGPASIASKIASKIVSPVSKIVGRAAPVVESALAGGGMSATQSAAEGGDALDGGLAGGALSGGISALPVVGKVLGKGAQELRTRSAVSDLVRSRKKTVEKSISQLGGGDKELGKQELKDLVKREGLVDVLEQPNIHESFAAKKRDVWAKELGPIHENALALEPDAKVSWKEIDAAARRLIKDAGASTPKAQTVRKALSDLKARAADAGYGKAGLPITETLENARALQEKGWAGVANFDSPTDIKQIARDFGRELRTLYDAKLGNIYKRHIGADEAANLGLKYKAGNERYSDLSKLNDPIEDLVARRQTERKGLISSLTDLKRQGAAAYIGHALGAGVPGAIVGVGLNEAARRAIPASLRATSKLAKGDGNPVSARTSATVSQWLKNYMGNANDGEGE